jgi:hypothetical protein
MIYSNAHGAYTSFVKKILSAIIIASLFSGSAMAQKGPFTFPLTKADFLDFHKKRTKAQFDALDKNKDGVLSYDEVFGEEIKYWEQTFDNTDTNKDGVVTQEEENAGIAKAKKAQEDAKKKQTEQKKDAPKK